MKKRIAIVGSRNFDDYTFVKKEVLKILCNRNIDVLDTEIVSGGAKGVDALAENFAEEFSLDKKIFLPDWERFGKSAGPIRNENIVKNSDLVIAFLKGDSKGTLSTIKIANRNNKIVEVVNV